ncbi:MAG: hypothetical protein FJW20_10650 [Acidimicrobiia bacterium]|nr:hypothetical protein [Acidimicrobiia bacterium]
MPPLVTSKTAADPLRESIEHARAQASEQLAAAWQLHVARLEEELRGGWRQHLEHLLEERFRQLAVEVESHWQGQLESARREQARRSSRQLSESLNRFCRGIRQAVKQQEWSGLLMEAAGEFSKLRALFTIQNGALRLERGVPELPPIECRLEEAPALMAAVSSLEPIAAAPSSAEISAPLAAEWGAMGIHRVRLFPVASRGKAVAVLCAAENEETVDSNALELLANLAGAVWEARSAPAGELIGIQPAVPAAEAAAWSRLPAGDQDLHLKAQRFARVQVAEMRLYQSEAVKQGRAARSLYELLREPIDAAREDFRAQFMEKSASMVDYFHQELLRTLANDDEGTLGPAYPGPLA